MALPVQKFREIVFQILYSADVSGSDESLMTPFMMAELKVTKSAMVRAHEKMRSILAKRDEIDALISGASHEYQFERISRVEKNILRLSLFEMLYDEEIPEKVAIAEAIRLTRKFGTPESAHFVNAILDVIYQRVRSEQPISQ